MKNLITVLLFGCAFLSCKNNDKKLVELEANDNKENLNYKIEALIKSYEDLEIFSGIILIADKGNPSYHKAFGLANRETNTENTVNTLFDIGSMNKTFTKIVVKQLISEGKLNLNDHLTDHISGFESPNIKKITIAHLLNHESGFGDYHFPEYFNLPIEQKTLQAIVERAKSKELFFEPGTENEYSNLGFVILGAVIEKVTGQSYFDTVKTRIIEPLNLKNTYIQNFEQLTNTIAKGYSYSPLGELEESYLMQDLPNPDGGFLSTTLDIMTFYRSYYYDTILISEAMKKTDPEFNYLESLPKGAAIGAAGGFDGFNTSLHQIFSDDKTIIVFANMDEPVAELIAEDILKIIRGKTPDKPKLPAIQNVRKYFETQGPEYVKNNFEELTTNYHPSDPKDFILNDLGYAYLYNANDAKKAEQLFKLNTDLFPNIANTWDSYGEALAQQSKIDQAIIAYNKALKIRPDLISAKKALIELNKK